MDPGVPLLGNRASGLSFSTSREAAMGPKQDSSHAGDQEIISSVSQSMCTLCFFSQGSPRIRLWGPIGATVRVMVSVWPCRVVRVVLSSCVAVKKDFPVTDLSLRGRGLGVVVRECSLMKRGWMKFPIAPESMNA